MKQMDLLTYAVSQKLKHGSQLWKFVRSGTDVPVHMVSEAFSDLLDTYEDAEANTIVNDYQGFIRHEVPVTMSPTEEGIRVDGYIDDGIFEIVSAIHNKDRDDVVFDAVNNVVSLFNPDKIVTLGDIAYYADELVKRHDENSVLRAVADKVADVTPKAVVYDAPVNTADTPLDKVEYEPFNIDTTALDEANASLDEAKKALLEMDSLANDTYETDVVEDEDDNNRIVVEAYNDFIRGIKELGLDKQLSFDKPLVMAL